MSEVENQTTAVPFGNTAIELTSEVLNGKKWDTKVTIGDHTVCWISGADIDAFVKALNEVIDSYRI